MSRQKPVEKVLKVQIRFEVSRVASECLANAYEQIVPVVQRATAATEEQTDVQPESIQPQVAGGQG